MDVDILKNLGVVAGGVLATVAPYMAKWLDKKFKRGEEAKMFIHNTGYRALINEVLVEIRTSVKANRVAIVEYHNGNTTINGLPFNYASMTYEKADTTTREILLNCQKVPISPVCELLLELHNSETGYERVDQEYKRDSIAELCKYYGIKTSYIFRIGNHIKYGTVHVSWVTEDSIFLTEQELDMLHTKVLYVNELISKMKRY